MQKKIFLTKLVMLVISILLLTYGILSSYAHQLGLCSVINGKKICLVNYSTEYGPLIFISLYFVIICPFLFFISAETFKKWLIYFFIWLFVDVLWVLSADTKSDYFGLTPTKETASIYMGFILVYTSFIWFALSKVQWHLWIKWFVGVISFIVAVVLTFVLT